MQAQVVFYGSLQNSKVHQGTYFQVLYELAQAKGQDFIPPNFGNLKVISGPSTSSSITIINGKREETYGFSYTLFAENQGDFQIPPAKIKVNGKYIKSNPIDLKIYPPLQPKHIPSDEDLGEMPYFVQAELSADTAMVGQQVILDYFLYSKKPIERVNFRVDPDLQDFFVLSPGLKSFPGNEEESVDINGNNFVKRRIKRLSLFPKTSGELHIGAAQFKLMIPSKGYGFFKTYESVFVNTEAQKVLVLPVPKNPPSSFCGVVGTYNIQCQHNKNRLTTDDVLTINVTIKGDGDKNKFVKPIILDHPKFEAYEPELVAENYLSQDDKVVQYTELSYSFIPLETGSYKLNPQISYINGEGFSWEIVQCDTLQITVFPGKSQSTETNPSSNAENKVALTEMSETDTRTAMYQTNYWPYWIWPISMLGAFILVLIQQNQREEVHVLTPKEAFDRDVDQWKANAESEAHQLEQLLMRYIEEDLDIPVEAWSEDQWKKSAKKKGWKQDLIDRVAQLLHQLSYASYAGTSASKNHAAWAKEAKEIVDEINFSSE